MQRYKQKHPNTIIEAMQQLHMDATYTVANEENTQESRHANVVSVTVPVGHWLVKTTENGVDYQTITWSVLSNEKFHSLYEPEAVKRKDEKIYPTPEDMKRIREAIERQKEKYQPWRKTPLDEQPVNPWIMPVDKPIDPWVPGTRPGFKNGQFWYFWNH